MAVKKPAPKKAAKVSKPAAKPAAKSTANAVVKAPAKKAISKKEEATVPAKKAVVAVKSVAKTVSKAPVKKAGAKKETEPAKKVASKKAVVKKAVAKVAVKSAVAKKLTTIKPTAKVVAKPTKLEAKVVETPIRKGALTTKTVAKVEEKPVAASAKKMAKSKAPEVPTTPRKPVKKALEPIKEVKVGKISTKSSVPYNPVYTPMEKRANTPAQSSGPLVKYSDSDLNEFRDLINKKMDTAKKELAYLQGLITRKDEGGGNDEARYMTMEDGSMSMEREQLSQMAGRQISYIDHLEKAIMRIENKTYGVCRVTGKLIDKARLRAVPHATLSLEAKLGLVKPGSE
jgi:RNA polymerase-binding transcription factor DksA